ncbi:SRPBCC family protein [Streptomyces sp. NPDC005969]|uniref:SRPBCC family protein n=1 Tax=Streptomyces sp. NPDC005969 TaxID=3156722 RepID=UPI0033F7EBCF
MKKLFYAGPSLEALHERYAKQGRIDHDAPVTSVSEIRIEASVERVWDVLADIASWERIRPGYRLLHLEGGVAVDARFGWAIGPTRIAGRFAVVDPGRELTWTGVAMGVKAIDQNLLTPLPDGTTLYRLEESMAAPLVGLFFRTDRLRNQHDQFLAAVKTEAERVIAHSLK